MNVDSVTILICTYNRCAFLAETLHALLSGTRRDRDYEVQIVVVDNNSTDDTRKVVEDAGRDAHFSVRYSFEPQQGKSFALNRGLREAQGQLIALTDDDVLPHDGWLDRMVEAFRTHDITFAFGKVLPRWEVLPPAELLLPRAHNIWGPLAILDYGDEPVAYEKGLPGQRLPIGANLGFRRQTLVEAGGWRTDLGKVNNSLISGEDHEIFHRLQEREQYHGLYDPRITVSHHVPAARMTRRYFRRWFYWHGKTMARMPGTIHQDLDMASVPHVFGVPRFLYRQSIEQGLRWLRYLGSRDSLGLLIEELKTIEYMGYLVQCWQRRAGRKGHGRPRLAPARPVGTAQ